MKARLLGGAVVVLAIAAGAAVFGLPHVTPQPDTVPTTHPTHGDLQVRVHALGELGPRRSMTVSAPSTGSRMQMVMLAPAGTAVHSGDVVIVFDPAEQRYNLQQASSELAEADEQLIKLKADALVQASQDQLNLLHARHELRRAEIAVTGNEFVGAIDAKKNDLALEEARRGLVQIEDDVKTHGVSSRAALAVAAEKRGKSQIAAEFARKNIESMTVRAPLDGLVVIQENRDAAGGFFFDGMTLPDYKVGDLVQPGSMIAEIVDISEMEIKARVPEAERASIAAGVHAQVTVEARGEAPMPAASKGEGGASSSNFWEPPTSRQVVGTFALTGPAPSLRPGMTAQVLVEGDTLTGVTHLPRQALFEKDGKPVVYVLKNGQFTARPVQIARLTETRVVLTGVAEDEQVALINPETAAARAAHERASGPMAGGGR